MDTVDTQARAFLRALFAELPSDQYFLIWSLQGEQKKSAWFQDTEAAAKYSLRTSVSANVYVGVGITSATVATHPQAQHSRAKTEEITGIVGLWADVDFQDKAHKKPNLPPTLDAAQALIRECGPEPTLLVHSGHGLQAWWLFREPWIFSNDSDRDEAATLTQRWNDTLRLRARQKNWDVDATHDLARVLRVAGTVNRKGEPVPVQLFHLSEQRYNPSEFESYLMAAETEIRAAPAIEAFTLDVHATPPFDKWEALCSIEPKALQSWQRTRKDLQDQSASAYDLSLATLAAKVNWSDQEIVNLLIASRRKHGDDLKLRFDYYARTLRKARLPIQLQQAQEALTEQQRDSTAVLSKVDMTERRKKILENLSALLTVKILRIIKYTSDPPSYRLETGAGTIQLGDVSAITQQQIFKNRVAAAANIMIPRCKGEAWDARAQALLDACEEESLGAEATEIGQAHAWLTEYLQDQNVTEDWNEALQEGVPFKRHGQYYIVAGGFRRWLYVRHEEKLSAKAMGMLLRSFGCEPEILGTEGTQGRTTRSVWRLPANGTGKSPFLTLPL